MEASQQESQEQLAYKATLKVEAIEIRDIFQSATDTSGETPENFKCNICSQLVWEPIECNQCDHIYCSHCI